MTGAGGKSILDRMRLDDRTAVVTGGGQGIGRAFAHALGEAGAKVCVADVELSLAENVVKELESKSIPAFAVKADCTSMDDIQVLLSPYPSVPPSLRPSVPRPVL